MGVTSESAGEVAASSATVQATIAPDGSATSYYFQLGTASTEGCTPTTCIDIPGEPGVPIGAGPGEVSVEQHAQDLSPAPSTTTAS